VSTQLHHLSKNPLLAYNVVAAYTRLKSLSQVASPMSVATTASVPTSPSSPSTAVITLGALIFGLLLGVAVATGRDALDRRLRHARDVAKVLDQPVIGHIRTDALGHSGAPAESANGVGPLEDPDQESFRILRQNIAYLGVTSKSVVLVTSAVAEEGKSTVAACLAVATAETGNRTLLVECDLRKPVLAKRLGLNATPGLTDYLTGHAEPHAILQTVPGISERLNGGRAAISGGAAGTANLVCITAGTTVHRPAELLASERFRTFLTDVSGVYDTVILDAAPLLPVADTLAIVPDASALVMCVRLGHTTRDQARGARAALGRLPERPVGVVITGVGQAQDGYYYQGDYSLPAPVSA
jgi:receptor protein-tyrosine kinase